MKRVLFFGMGSIGSRHYRLLNKNAPNWSYYAFRRDINKVYHDGLLSVYSWDEIDELGFDMAFICNPTSEHVDTAINCAKRQIHLFIEKPLSNSLNRVDELVYYVQKNALKVLVGFNLRFHPVVERLQSIMNENRDSIYRFSAYCGSYLPDWRKGDYRRTYSAFRKQGGGVVLDLIHELDYCTWIFGQPDMVTGYYAKCSSLEIDSEDIAEIILGYSDYAGYIHLDYFRPLPKRCVEVITEFSVIEADLLNGYLSISNKMGNVLEEYYELHPDLTYEKQLLHFIDVINGNASPKSSLDEAVAVLKLALSFKSIGEIAR